MLVSASSTSKSRWCDGGRVTELGVDHQGGLVEAHQVAAQSAHASLAVRGIVEQLEGQRRHLAGPGAVGALGAFERLGLPGEEEPEAHGQGDDDAEADRRAGPAQVAEGEGAVQEVAEEEAHEEQLPRDQPAGTEPSEIGAPGQDHRQQDQGENALAADGDAKGQRRDHRDGQEERGDQLPLGRGVEDPEARDHPDDGPEQHHDDEGVVVGDGDLGRLGRRQHRPGGLNLQGVGEPHEDQLRLENQPDGEHGHQCGAQPVQAGVGAEKSINHVPGPVASTRDRGAQGGDLVP
jgi:hypothetical protein